MTSKPRRAISISVNGLRHFMKEAGETGLYVELYDGGDKESNAQDMDGLVLIAEVIQPFDGFRYVCINQPYPRQIWKYKEYASDDCRITNWGRMEYIEGKNKPETEKK